jgi:hypothetical protein
MQTFKQYMIDEMGGDVAVGFKSSQTGEFKSKKAEEYLRPILFDADMLLRKKDRLSDDTIKDQASELLNKFVVGYESLGDEVTDLKAKIAGKYTQVKKLLQDREHTVEDCVQMVEQVLGLLRG